jgi:hypothetical protein
MRRLEIQNDKCFTIYILSFGSFRCAEATKLMNYSKARLRA